MLNIDRALGNDRLIKAMTGVSASEFNELTKSFEEEFHNEAHNRYEIGVEIGDRERKPGGGRIGKFSNSRLIYTFDPKLFVAMSPLAVDLFGGGTKCVTKCLQNIRKMMKDHHLLHAFTITTKIANGVIVLL